MDTPETPQPVDENGNPILPPVEPAIESGAPESDPNASPTLAVAEPVTVPVTGSISQIFTGESRVPPNAVVNAPATLGLDPATGMDFVEWMCYSVMSFLDLIEINEAGRYAAVSPLGEKKITDILSTADATLMLMAKYADATENKDMMEKVELFTGRSKRMRAWIGL